jgi:hypothetical protein
VQEHQVSQEQEVVAAFFQLVDSLLRSAPGILLPAEQLPTLITWACASLRVWPMAVQLPLLTQCLWTPGCIRHARS